MTVKRLALAGAGLALILLLLGACSRLALTPNPTATATSTPTPPPTSTPTPLPLAAQELLAAAAEAVKEVGSYHFDTAIQMTVTTADGSMTMKVPMTFVGDFQQPDRLKATMTVEVLGQRTEGDMIVIGDTAYTKDSTTGEWQSTLADQADPGGLAVIDPETIQDPTFVGEESLTGRPVYHLTGAVAYPTNLVESMLSGYELTADLKSDYWIDRESSYIVKATMQGDVEALGELDITIAVSATALYSDYGQSVEIEAPQVAGEEPVPARPGSLPALSSDSVAAHLERGLASLADDRLGLAAIHFRRAAELQPGLSDIPLLYRGLALLLLGQGDVAAQEFSRLIELDPDRADAYLLRALSTDIKLWKGEQCPDVARAAELDPDLVEARTLQALCHCLTGADRTKRGSEAIDLLAEARAMDAATADPYYAAAAYRCLVLQP